MQPGNSGGPIIYNRGNVVGVAVSKLSLERVLEDYGVIPENINFGVKASVVKNFLESNSVELKRPKDGAISRKELSLMVAESTTFLSCWMTEEEIKKIKSSKVLFRHIYD